jgi:hypothetical protein
MTQELDLLEGHPVQCGRIGQWLITNMLADMQKREP